jgi:hypothetical protein
MEQARLDHRLAEMPATKVMLRVLLREWSREHPRAADNSSGMSPRNHAPSRRWPRGAKCSAHGCTGKGDGRHCDGCSPGQACRNLAARM